MSKAPATTNPVQYTYGRPNTGSTAKSVPHPEPISAATYTISGLKTVVFGISELPPNVTQVAVLWLLHPRLQTQECMAPFAAHLITEWNDHLRQTRIKHPSSSTSKHEKGLIAVSFDQRNHGTRLMSARANEAWRSGNPTHALDMFSQVNGTATDTFFLLDYLTSYVFPAGGVSIVQNIVLGISLGGHAAWQCVMQDIRINAAIVTIGCPDYISMMSDRARLSKRKTWLEGQGEGFLGSEDFPTGLVEVVRRWDPVGIISAAAQKDVGFSAFDQLNSQEEKRLRHVMETFFAGKRILTLSGGADKLVPYAHGEPFLKWLKKSSGKDGFFHDGDLIIEDIVVPGVGHDVPPEMVEHMVRFLLETLDGSSANLRGRRGVSRQSRL